jgi:hypothetical protein
VSTLEQLARIIYFGSVPITVLGFGQIWWGLQGEIQNILIPGWYLRAMGNPSGRMSSLFYRLFGTWYGSIWGHKSTKSLSGKRFN